MAVSTIRAGSAASQVYYSNNGQSSEAEAIDVICSKEFREMFADMSIPCVTPLGQIVDKIALWLKNGLRNGTDICQRQYDLEDVIMPPRQEQNAGHTISGDQHFQPHSAPAKKRISRYEITNTMAVPKQPLFTFLIYKNQVPYITKLEIPHHYVNFSKHIIDITLSLTNDYGEIIPFNDFSVTQCMASIFHFYLSPHYFLRSCVLKPIHPRDSLKSVNKIINFTTPALIANSTWILSARVHNPNKPIQMELSKTFVDTLIQILFEINFCE